MANELNKPTLSDMYLRGEITWNEHEAGGVAAMPATKERRPHDDMHPEGYLESDESWAQENWEAVRWLADNHTAIRAVVFSAGEPSHGNQPPAAGAIDAHHFQDAIRAAEISHSGMSYGDEKNGAPSEYARGWGDCLKAIRGATPRPHVANSWQRVPPTPTKEMIEAAASTPEAEDAKQDIENMWRAMLAAAPGAAIDAREQPEVDALRAEGWTVAVHNDYRLNGEPHTFWLFTKGDRAAKGEGRTDAEALAQVRSALASPPEAPPVAEVEQCIVALTEALVQSKGWMYDYAGSIVRDAIDRKHLMDEAPAAGAIDARGQEARCKKCDSPNICGRLGCAAASREESPASPDAGSGAVAGLDVDALAQEIRRVDGSNSLGAGALAEALMPFLAAPAPAPDMRAICEALGFDPTNHHNAAKCPYCRPPEAPEQQGEASAYLLTRPSGFQWVLMPFDITPQTRAIFGAEGTTIEPLHRSALTAVQADTKGGV